MKQIPPREDLQVIVSLQRLASREVVVVVVRKEFGDEMSHGRNVFFRRAGGSAQNWPQQLRLKEPARKGRQDDRRETDHGAIHH
jgi:hypothetical protein